MFRRLSLLKIDWRSLCVKTLTASVFFFGVLFLTAGIVNIFFPHLLFNRVVLYLAQRVSEDGHVMAATIEDLYRLW